MAAVLLSNLTVLETAPAGTVIGTLSVSEIGGNETFTFSLADSLSDRFEITLNTTSGLYELVVKTSGSSLFDFETDGLKEFAISVTATGDKGTVISDTPFTITVTDNTAPTDITLSNASITEHSANGTEVGSLSAIDPDLDETFTFTLKTDESGAFAIIDGKLVVADGSKLDYLTDSLHQVTIEVTDADNNVFEKTLDISVTDAFDFLNGTAKNDRLVGTAGADMIKGFSGNDKLYGMAGDDVLAGGYGKDFLYGGAGKDTFVFDNPVKKGHFDHIADFTSADDTIQISLSALKAYKVKVAKEEVYESLEGTKAGKQKGFFSLDKVFDKGKLESKFFTKGHAKDTYDFVTYDSKTGFVYLDLDGSGGGKGFAIAKLKPGTYVQADDFVFI